MRTEIDVRIMLKDHEGQSFMGIGLVWLLSGIDRCRSVSSAAREMDLSYPKALRIIKNLERGLGKQVIVRRKGGSERGGAELTPYGREFLARYDRVQRKIKHLGAAVFARELAGFLANDHH